MDNLRGLLSLKKYAVSTTGQFFIANSGNLSGKIPNILSPVIVNLQILPVL